MKVRSLNYVHLDSSICFDHNVIWMVYKSSTITQINWWDQVANNKGTITANFSCCEILSPKYGIISTNMDQLWTNLKWFTLIYKVITSNIFALLKFMCGACGLVEQCRTPGRQAECQAPASANVFVFLGKILSPNCFFDLSSTC